MPDPDDDWMQPRPSVSYSFDRVAAEKRRLESPFLIQREKVIQCSWAGEGPPTAWNEWSRHSTKEDRDVELARLRKEHPAWHLRARQLDGRGRMLEPTHIDYP